MIRADLLTTWASSQRSSYRNRTLPAWKVAFLEDLPGWSWSRRRPVFHSHSRRTLKEWVLVAQKLTRQHGGVLPGIGWLYQNGFRALYAIMKKYPHLFVHIKTTKSGRRSPSEWAEVANALVNKYGFIPHIGRLNRLRLTGLVKAISLYPALFAGFPRESAHRTLKEWVVFAEVLSNKYRGKLPNPHQLAKVGHSALSRAIGHHPEAFAHLTIESGKSGKKTVAEWVSIAEQLANGNNGLLPSKAHLKRGYRGLVHALQDVPAKFVHIPQDVGVNKWKRAVHGGGRKGAAIAQSLGVLHEP